jgi:hypothetical protein
LFRPRLQLVREAQVDPSHAALVGVGGCFGRAFGFARLIAHGF